MKLPVSDWSVLLLLEGKYPPGELTDLDMSLALLELYEDPMLEAEGEGECPELALVFKAERPCVEGRRGRCSFSGTRSTRPDGD